MVPSLPEAILKHDISPSLCRANTRRHWRQTVKRGEEGKDRRPLHCGPSLFLLRVFFVSSSLEHSLTGKEGKFSPAISFLTALDACKTSPPGRVFSRSLHDNLPFPFLCRADPRIASFFWHSSATGSFHSLHNSRYSVLRLGYRGRTSFNTLIRTNLYGIGPDCGLYQN